MIKAENEADQILIAKVYRAEQEQIFQFWDLLDDTQRCKLLKQVRDIDFQQMSRLVRQHLRGTSERLLLCTHKPPPTIGAADASEVARSEQGEAFVRQGKLALVMVAGGQAARLGSKGPQGTYPVGPVSGRSLFEIHTHRIVAARKHYRCPVPLFIMVSELNAQATLQVFEQNNYFGLPKGEVFFFSQRKLPSVDLRGKILLTAEDQIQFNPNGHGGAFDALASQGHLDEMDRRGIELISYFQVNNPLCNPIDPRFIGYHLAADAEMSVKVVPKRSAHEKLSVVVETGDHLGVVNYQQMSDEERSALDEGGKLRYRAGNAAIHLIDARFLRRFAGSGNALPHHAHRKPIKTVIRKGDAAQRETQMGVRFETCIFDALAEAERTLVYELDRAAEFAPLKNAEGPDSPKTVRQAISNHFGSWLEQVGRPVPRDPQGAVTTSLEVDPRFAFTVEDLREKLEGVSLDLDSDLYLH